MSKPPRPKRSFRKVPEFLSLPTDRVPLSHDTPGSRSSYRGRNSRTLRKSPLPRDGSGSDVHRFNRGSPLPPDSPGDSPIPLSTRIQADSLDMRREIDNLVEHVRSVAMDHTPSTSGGVHFDWAGDEDDSLPDLDDWGVTTASAGLEDEKCLPRVGQPLHDTVEDAHSSPVIPKSVDPYHVSPPITLTVDSSLDSNNPFSEQSIVPNVSLPAHRRVPIRLEDNSLKHSHPLSMCQVDPTSIPLFEHDPLMSAFSLDNVSYSVLLPSTHPSRRGRSSRPFSLSEGHTNIIPPLLRIKESREIPAGDEVTGEDIAGALETSNEIQPTEGYQMTRTQQYLTPELEPTRTDDLETSMHFPETRSMLQFTSEIDRLSTSQTPPRSPRRHDSQHLLPMLTPFLPQRLSRSRSPTPHRTYTPPFGNRHVRTHSTPQSGVSLPHRPPQAHRPIISGDAISRLAFAINNSASSKHQATQANATKQ
jgi:hypothetical protein